MSKESSEDPIGHHLVPKFYLRGFSSSDKLRVLSKRLRKSFFNSVTRASRRNYFYSKLISENLYDPALEDWMAQIEGRVAPIWAALDTEKSLGDEERTSVAEFIALQLARSNEWRLVVEEILLGFRNALLEQGADVNSMDLTEMSIRAVSKDVHLESVEDSVTSFSKALLNRSDWVLMKLSRPMFLTSDAPVVILPLGANLETSEVITMPVSSTKVLMILGKRFTQSQNGLDSSMIRNINVHVASQADDLVFLHPDVDYSLKKPPLSWRYEELQRTR